MSAHEQPDIAIKVHGKRHWTCAQSPMGDHMPSLPSRGIFLAPSGSFKTVAIVDLILRHFRGCFERIIVLSPSVDIDSAWEPVKKYSEEKLKVNPRKEQNFFSTFDEEALQEQVDIHFEVVKEEKRRGYRKLSQMLVVVDDFSDDPHTLHASGRRNILNSLATRGRHGFISLWISAQKLTTISPVIRTQVSFYCVGRLRSDTELKAWLSEVSATHDAVTLKKMYDTATLHSPHSFLYVNLSEHPVGFYLNFEYRLTPVE